jgi:hypothetical protein
MEDPVLTGVYIGATAAELRANTVADKSAGIVSQKAMFRRRGAIELRADALVLSAWDDHGDLVLRRPTPASSPACTAVFSAASSMPANR